jgi:hypothetical protein
MLDSLATMPSQEALGVGLLVAVAIELATIVLRFGGGWKSPEVTRCCSRWTRGWRVHHGYVGVAFVLGALLLPMPAAVATIALVLGVGLAISDALHHFAVLWPVTGSHEFYVRYPCEAGAVDEGAAGRD